MSRITEQFFNLDRRASGHIKIAGVSLVGETIPEFSLGPGRPPKELYSVEDSTFARCRVEPGAFRIRRGVELCNVIFDAVYSRSGITISTGAVLDRVVFKGRCGALWIKPDERQECGVLDWVASRAAETDQMIDISKHEGGEVALIGLPGGKVELDPERHVRIMASWADSVDWEVLGIGSDSFWTTAVRYIRGFDVEEGIFSLPSKRRGDYRQTMEEMGRLVAAGVIHAGKFRVRPSN